MDRCAQKDQDIWNDFIGGSQEAFRQLYEQYADLLYAFGLKYTRDEELLKDCIHDLFVDLHTYRRNLSLAMNVRYYLLRSLKRKMNAAFKRSSRDLDYPQGEFVLVCSAEEVILTDEQQLETLRLLAGEMNRLPARQKEALYLKFHQELDYDEVAALMKISVPTCRTLVYRGIKQLRLNLKEQPVYPVLLLLFRAARPEKTQ
ncbi:MAG TPA: sigma-70 family RNA polymerase sigma factor [Anseongella sp.]|nr:sigma-70 family RNA polymerase sigma factor [Anseongella sp.]